MSVGISIHTEYEDGEPTRLNLRTSRPPMWDNANSLTLLFNETQVTLFHLSVGDAELLWRIASMSDMQRAGLLGDMISSEEEGEAA